MGVTLIATVNNLPRLVSDSRLESSPLLWLGGLPGYKSKAANGHVAATGAWDIKEPYMQGRYGVLPVYIVGRKRRCNPSCYKSLLGKPLTGKKATQNVGHSHMIQDAGAFAGAVHCPHRIAHVDGTDTKPC